MESTCEIRYFFVVENWCSRRTLAEFSVTPSTSLSPTLTTLTSSRFIVDSASETATAAPCSLEFSHPNEISVQTMMVFIEEWRINGWQNYYLNIVIKCWAQNNGFLTINLPVLQSSFLMLSFYAEYPMIKCILNYMINRVIFQTDICLYSTFLFKMNIILETMDDFFQWRKA